MLLSPPVLALLCCSGMICTLTVMAALAAGATAIGWDHQSSDRRQLLRERRWLLIETSVRLALATQLISLILFVAAAERFKTLFTGAMCAIGTLRASPLGTPTLAVKVSVFVLCALWLITDRASPAAASTGLVRFKAAFLALVALALVAENVLQALYFADLDPEVITSCCATVFSPDAAGVAAGLARLPTGWTQLAFFACLAITVSAGLRAIRRRTGTAAYSASAVCFGGITAAAIVSWIAPSYYELPTHHCPLCLLAPDHGFVGYPLYLLLAAGVVSGVGAGLVGAIRRLDRHRCIRSDAESRLCAASVVSFAAVAAISTWPLATSPFRLGGY